MTLNPNPREWRCKWCETVNGSGPVVETLDDGGERWVLRCGFCLARIPVATITGHGVQLRERMRRARETGNTAKAEKLLKRYRAEVTRG